MNTASSKQQAKSEEAINLQYTPGLPVLVNGAVFSQVPQVQRPFQRAAHHKVRLRVAQK